MPKITSVCYFSKATQTLGDADVQRLADLAAEKNARLGITGYLYAHRDHYFQYLEGPSAGLQELMDTIAGDERHQVLVRHDLGELEHRRFQGWSMRYLQSSALDKIGLEHLLFEFMQDITKASYAETWVRNQIVGVVNKLSQFQEVLSRAGGARGEA